MEPEKRKIKRAAAEVDNKERNEWQGGEGKGRRSELGRLEPKIICWY